MAAKSAAKSLTAPARRPTKADVAKVARVSAMTVSRVLSAHPYVRSDTRSKVLAACRRLRYRSNLSASSLRGCGSRAIGVIVETFRHAYYARILDGIEECARRNRYHIVVHQARQVAHRTACLNWSDIEFLLARPVDGLVLHLAGQGTLVGRLKKEGIPLVLIDQAPSRAVLSVGTADREGARTLTSYLVSLGHRRIAFLAGQESSYTSRERLQGYRVAMAEAGLSVKPQWIVPTDYRLEGGRQAMGRLLDAVGAADFTCVVAANDYVAIGAMHTLWERGIPVPARMSVAGFTGDEIGEHLAPPLTTMLQPGEEIGARAVELLLAQLAGGEPPGPVLLPARLMIRGSTAAPAG